MHILSWLVFVVFALILPVVENASVVRLCGRKLVNTMKALCNHRYVTPEPPPLISHHSQRARNGIAEHCCFRPCSYSYLKSFCDDEITSTTTTEQYTNELEDLIEDAENGQKKFDAAKNSQSRQVPVKTFRSLFHLLSYISQLWTSQTKNATVDQAPSADVEVEEK